MKYIIDRIEKNIVICENQENKKIEEFEIEKFPKNIQEGDILFLENGKFKKDDKETQKQKEKIQELMKKLMKG